MIRAPAVVSNADLQGTVTRLLPPGALPDDVVATVEGYEMTLPLFVVYLILDRDLAAEMPNTNLWLLGDDVEAEYAQLFAGGLSEQPMTYITSASLKDPTNPRLCGPGQTNVQRTSILRIKGRKVGSLNFSSSKSSSQTLPRLRATAMT